MTERNGDIRELPQGWASATLDDLIGSGGIFCDGDWIESQDQDPEGEIRLIQLADIGDGVFKNKSERFLTLKKSIDLGCTYLDKGDLLIARLPDPLGRACIFPLEGKQKFVTAVDVCIVRPNTRNISNKYLLYLINSPKIRSNISEFQTGSTRKRISRKNLSKIELFIAPSNEQKRIVEKIEELFSELDQGIENLKTAQKQLKVYRQAVLKWAFEGKLTEQWRQQAQQQGTLQTGEELLAQIKAERENRYQQQVAEWEAAVKTWEANGKPGKKPSKPSKPKDLTPLTPSELAELPQLPDDWCWARVNQLGDVQLGRQRSPQNRSKDFPTKYIRAANITEEGFDLADVLDMEFKPHEFEQYQLKYGDLLLSEASGSLEQVGKPALWRNQIPNCCFQNTVIRFRPICLPSEYFLWCFKNFYSNGVFAEVASGVGINHLSANKFSVIPVPVAPLEEQEQIVQEIESRLSNCDQLENAIAENLQKAEALRQSILKQAFEGKLVPQDPNDEPAEKLLERIRAEKAKRQPPGKQLTIKMSRSKENANDLED